MIPTMRPQARAPEPGVHRQDRRRSLSPPRTTGHLRREPRGPGPSGRGRDEGRRRRRSGSTSTRRLVEACLATTPVGHQAVRPVGPKGIRRRRRRDPLRSGLGRPSRSWTTRRRPSARPDTADLVRLYRLVETLANIDFQSTALVSADVPHTIADAYRLYLGLLHSAKPFVTGTFRVEGFRPMHDMLVGRPGKRRRARGTSRWPSSTPAPPLPSSGAT